MAFDERERTRAVEDLASAVWFFLDRTMRENPGDIFSSFLKPGKYKVNVSLFSKNDNLLMQQWIWIKVGARPYMEVDWESGEEKT